MYIYNVVKLGHGQNNDMFLHTAIGWYRAVVVARSCPPHKNEGFPQKTNPAGSSVLGRGWDHSILKFED